MKVLHVIAGAPVGGAETFAQDAILALAEQGIEQVVITRPHPIAMARFQAAGVRVIHRQFGLADRLLGAAAIRREAQALGADIVHAWMSRAASAIPAGMPCPVIGWFGDYYKMRYFKRCDHHMAVTPDIVRYILSEGARPHRAGLVNTFGTLPDAPAIDRAALDTPAEAPVILVLSRMHAVKGIDTILTALTEVPGAYLWLAGDGPELERYRTLSRTLGLADRVRFLGWRTDRKALLEACDICALPSRYEPFGTVIVEAWAMKRPLAAAAAAGARQYVVDGANGLLSPIDDAPALAASLRRLVAEPDLRARLVETAYEDYQRTFTRERVTQRLIDYYQRAIALGPASQDVFAAAPDGTMAPTDDPAQRAAMVASAYAGQPHATEVTTIELSGAASFLDEKHKVLRVRAQDLDLILALPLWKDIQSAFGEAAAQIVAQTGQT